MINQQQLYHVLFFGATSIAINQLDHQREWSLCFVFTGEPIVIKVLFVALYHVSSDFVASMYATLMQVSI